MSQATAYEQYFLELINAERAKTGAQPLSFNDQLNDAADNHTNWMISTNTFSHTGVSGWDPGTRMKAAGYSFTGSWAWGENIAWASLRGAPGYQDEVELLHTNFMNSPGHRANILNATYREIGLGFNVAAFQGYNSAVITEDFAKSGTAVFLTGVAFDDKDGDHFYDIGEGLGGLTVSVTSSTGAHYTTSTETAGGYDLALAPGAYTVTFSGANITSSSQQFTIGTQNVKVDLDTDVGTGSGGGGGGGGGGGTGGQGPITGTASSETLQGTQGDDIIQGLGGSDTLYGNTGNDTIDGGTGNDVIYGGAGKDTMTGGGNNDYFVFDNLDGNIDNVTDFSHTSDTIRLDRDVFTAFTRTGTISSSAFWMGAAAHDSTDRIMYDTTSGDLIYDSDGTGPNAAVHFAHIGAVSGISYTDFVIIA